MNRQELAKIRSQPPEKWRDAMADHLLYELRRVRDSRKALEVRTNADALELFLLHMRTLIEFFVDDPRCPSARAPRARKPLERDSDLRPDDFVAEWRTPNSGEAGEAACALRSELETIDQQLSHLSLARSLEPGPHPSWITEPMVLVRPLQLVAKDWCQGDLPAGHRSAWIRTAINDLDG
jgi:hypothetical protein